MSEKRKGYYLIAFAVAYFIFTAFIAKHGIHFLNVALTAGILLWGIVLVGKK